jgi:hypothetical protein
MGDMVMVQNGFDNSVFGYESPEHNANSVTVQSSKSNVILPLLLLYC